MKGIGIIKKLSAIILTVTLMFCMFNFIVACGNDDKKTPAYTFPEVSDTLIDGAYFITDAGFAEYKKEHNAYDGLKSSLTVAICNNKLSATIFKYEYTLYRENGIYCGKAYGLGEGHYIDVALDGDMLYIKRYNTKTDHYQYKLDTSYAVNSEYEYELELPQTYLWQFDDSNKSHATFSWHSENKFQGVGELQPAGEESFTILNYGSFFIGKMRLLYNDKNLKVGKNIMKFYLKGKPDIDYDNKTVYLVKDSPSLLFEVYFNKNNTVTVTGENDEPYGYTFPTESDPLKDGVYYMTDAGYEIYGREHPKYNGNRRYFYVAIHNDKAYISFYEKFGYTLYYENGIYHGKAYWKGDENDVDLALKGDMLYVKLYGSPSNNYEYKLDTNYTADPEYGYILRPPLYSSISFNTQTGKYSYPYVQFEIDSTEPDFIAELQPAGEDDFTILQYSYQIIAKRIYFGPGELKVGKNTVKLYRKGRPTIDTSKKIFYTTQDSSILLYEVYVYEDNTVTVT